MHPGFIAIFSACSDSFINHGHNSSSLVAFKPKHELDNLSLFRVSDICTVFSISYQCMLLLHM